tara:strand:+ start:4816 stop:5697 length:882 start_codon:yes stop_codon:yes gene_type:complete
MVKRKIIQINEDKCDGCGLCIPDCPEGALQIIDGKARLISDLFCDGLGACIGLCPKDAIKVVEREAEPYDEIKTMGNIVKKGKNTIKAHLSHLKDHGETKFLEQALVYLKEKGIENPLKEVKKVEREKGRKKEGKTEKQSEQPKLACGCPGSMMQDFRKDNDTNKSTENIKLQSELRQWPIQLHLVNPNAPYFNDADLLICADCVAYSYGGFHQNFLKNKIVIIACPKLDDTSTYVEKISEIIKNNNIKSITELHMEVPCCFSLFRITKEAIKLSGKNIKFESKIISIKGNIK